MSGASSIEWTDATWNPVRGCSRVSEGCRNCYAERHAARFRAPGRPFDGFVKTHVNGEPRWTGRVELIPHLLDWPLRKKKPLRIFVNSMSDLFHERLEFHEIAAVFGVMLLAEQHTFQILTKRPGRARQFFRWIEGVPLRFGCSGENAVPLEGGPAHACLTILGAMTPPELANGPLFTALLCGGLQPRKDAPIRSLWPLPNVWIGVSVEDQATADERIPLLLQTPAAKRFVSYEPALGPVDFRSHLKPTLTTRSGERLQHPDPRAKSEGGAWSWGLDWLIAGGESGPGARPFDVAWARSTVAQCKAAGVACFVKQLGARPFEDDGAILGAPIDRSKVGRLPGAAMKNRKGGDWSEWPEDLRVREFPT